MLTLMGDEDGADRVQEVLETAHVLIPWTVLAEVYYITQQKLGQNAADLRYAAIRRLDAEFPSDIPESILLTASRWKAVHRMSFADSLIAAYASQSAATLLHKDPEFEALQDQVSLEALPYKA